MQSRTHYLYELGEVQRSLLLLSEATERMLRRALRALQHNDLVTARLAIHDDDEIDERRTGIEDRIFQLVSTQQPIAADLRFLLATLWIADELERIGDYAEGIATLVVRNPDEPLLAPPPEFTTLVEAVTALLRASVEAFIARDAHAADRIDQDDDRIDQLVATLQRQIKQYLQAQPASPVRALHILFVAHNLERIADRALNIADRTNFIVTGKPPQRRRRHIRRE